MMNGRAELQIIHGDTATEDRCCQQVILCPVRLFQGAIGADFVFMDDKDRPHRTLAVEELLQSEVVTRMDWPAYSPDFSPIAHVWYDLGRRVSAGLYPPENTQQLKQTLIEEWTLLPHQLLDNLVLSMERRCLATISVKEGPIP